MPLATTLTSQGGYDAALEAAAATGVPGAALLPADELLLTLAPMRQYDAGARNQGVGAGGAKGGYVGTAGTAAAVCRAPQ